MYMNVSVEIHHDDCYVDCGSYVVYGHVNADGEGYRLVAVAEPGAGQLDVAYAVEPLDGGDDADITLPESALSDIRALATAALATRAA